MNEIQTEITIVWFKRDLRLEDHLPLKKAIESSFKNNRNLLLMSFLEPDLESNGHYSDMHWRFMFESIQDLNNQLLTYSQKIFFNYCNPILFFETIHKNFKIKDIYSYQESGIEITYKRDLQMKTFCKINKIEWFEFQNNGVERSLRNRKNWVEKWMNFMERPLDTPDLSKLNTFDYNGFQNLIQPIPERIKTYIHGFQPGGRTSGLKYLHSFMNGRVSKYMKSISKPELSRSGCSRISPYLAWGCLSSREVFQIATLKLKEGKYKRDLNQFIDRLRWRDHFIQKFEMECSMELNNLNKGFNNIKKPKNEDYLNAWQNGTTGFPLVDACMRCLKSTGYINFRMRSMVVSFATHHLNQDWKDIAKYLASVFLDFEPGIHYPQLQMQAGTTGINTVRIYNPLKQAQDNDSEGVFIKKWIPDLGKVPVPLLFEPHKLTYMDKVMFGIKKNAYPLPIIDLEESGRAARETIWKAQKSPDVIKDSWRVLHKHTIIGRKRIS